MKKIIKQSLFFWLGVAMGISGGCKMTENDGLKWSFILMVAVFVVWVLTTKIKVSEDKSPE